MVSKRQQKIDLVFDEIYTQLFLEAEPSASYKKLVAQNKSKELPFDWFLKYYLNQDRQEEIVREICKKHRLPKRDIHRFQNAIALGHSPAGWKKEGEKNEK